MEAVQPGASEIDRDMNFRHLVHRCDIFLDIK